LRAPSVDRYRVDLLSPRKLPTPPRTARSFGLRRIWLHDGRLRVGSLRCVRSHGRVRHGDRDRLLTLTRIGDILDDRDREKVRIAFGGRVIVRDLFRDRSRPNFLSVAGVDENQLTDREIGPAEEPQGLDPLALVEPPRRLLVLGIGVVTMEP